MPRIRVATTIDAPAAAVWDEVRLVERHVEWMADAEAIRFTSERRAGVGTTFDCDTRVGPLRLTDRMEITEWEEGRSIGVRHVGLVTGTGRFTLMPLGDSRTTFAWEEELRFPRWALGRVGDLVGGLVLRLVWRRNLRRLRARVESAR